MGFNIKKYFEKYSAFLEGMGSLSFFPNNNSKPYWMRKDLTPQEQDALAQEQDALTMKGDWEKVGENMKNSINYLKKSLYDKLGN